MMTIPRRFAVGMGVFLAGAVLLVWDLGRASPVIEWMSMFRVSDFDSFGDAFPFLAELRVPIPPHLALIEIADYQLTGDTWFSNVLLYKVYVVVAYTCAVLLAYPSTTRLAVSGVLGWIFIQSTSVIHPGNPMLYDVAAPCFFMLFLLLLRIGTSTRIYLRGAAAALIGSGLMLSMFELSRPFVILLLPAILVLAALRIGLRRRLLYFVVPIVLVTGTWHVHLALAHRQFTASNHFGVNLWRCWSSKVAPLEKPVVEDDAPLAEGRKPNLNNPQHLKNSLRLRKRIVRYVLAHPADSFTFVLHRLRVFTRGETAIYGHKPDHPVLAAYSPLVLALFWWSMLGGFWFGARSIWLAARDRVRLRAWLADLDNLIVLVISASTVILAVGEIEEEARLVITLLPLLAAAPHFHRLSVLDPRRWWRSRRDAD